MFLMEHSGRRSVLKVAMISNSKAFVEENCLKWLAERRVAPLLYQSIMIDGHTGIHMEFINGKSILSMVQEYLISSSYDSIYPLFSTLGELLADVHYVPIDNKLELPGLLFEAPLEKAFIDANLHKRSIELFKDFGETLGQPPVLLHGDFGYHNVIRDSSGSNRLIDWELASIGDPRVDVANVLFWTHLHFPDIALDCGRVFVDGYKARRRAGCSLEELHTFVIYQIWRIIDMVKDEFPNQVKLEWNRRLLWAFDHVFI
ncbi:hypothetical protein J2TS4_08930 [Paenibacillus sp. J2TS4]|nr:hypothetical protein J2TS4_08930 [Paenibacillus sp. J2TS4]